MIRPLEYDARVRVRGFSVLDEDFDFMLVDLCRDAREGADRDRTETASVKKPWKTPFSIGGALRGMSKGLFPRRVG